ncbi:ROK family protein [Naumannella halotolerans]|uniref:ROK family protein n=1 Tax=Naumannella halotolerans TaxID=993414 RepID=UPI00370D606B
MITAVADVGGTDTKLGVVEDAELLSSTTVPTPVGDVTALRRLVADFVASARTDHRIGATAMVVPGIVDPATGVAVHSENLHWFEVPFGRWLAADTGLPAALGHDVTAAGYAEHRHGAARGHAHAAVVVVGTGIAASLIEDGRVINRAGVGEIGHSVVQEGGPSCVCGGRGCLEVIASAAAIGRTYTARTGRVASAAAISTRIDTDPDAAAVWDRAVQALAAGIGQLQSLLPSELVVIGGGLSLAGEVLFAPLRDAVERRLTMQRIPRIVGARFGATAGMIGAAELARDAAKGR